MFVAQKDRVRRVQNHPPVPPTLIYLSLNIKMLENFQVVEMGTVPAQSGSHWRLWSIHWHSPNVPAHANQKTTAKPMRFSTAIMCHRHLPTNTPLSVISVLKYRGIVEKLQKMRNFAKQQSITLKIRQYYAQRWTMTMKIIWPNTMF